MTNAYLIDASIYIFRAWHTLPDTIRDNHGNAANATFGFSEFLLKLLSEQSPSHIACAFDECREGAVRKRIYPPYKANRPATPADLKRQFTASRACAEALGIACFGSLHYEADDIIGTLAKHARNQGANCTIISADKDLAQFIRPGDCLWNYAKKHKQSYRDVCKHYRLNPEQIPDMLALSGDKVDNIPGVPGVGMHTAARLLYKWGTLENLYAHLPEAAMMKFRGAKRVADLLGDYRDRVFLARKLTGLLEDDSLPASLDALRLQTVDAEQLEAIFEANAFSSERRRRWLSTLTRASGNAIASCPPPSCY